MTRKKIIIAKTRREKYELKRAKRRLM